MEEKNQKIKPKVLFQATNSVLFRTTLIGNLYEISQVYPTVLLLGERVDFETERILHNKELFPKLQKIIFCEEPFYGKILIKNNRLYRTVKKVVRNYRPDIVILADDTNPMSLYLIRIAKKMRAVTVVIQSGFQVAEGEKLCLWSCLKNSYLKMPSFLPFSVRLLFVKLKKYLGHFFYYWILPLTVGEMPFRGKTSFVFWKISPGLRDADYSVLFSKREYNLCIKDGVPAEKMFILNHPLKRDATKKFFKKAYFSSDKPKSNTKILTIMLSGEQIGLKRDDYSLISKEEIEKVIVKIITSITTILKEWRVFVKSYPRGTNILEIKKIFEPISDYITVIDPLEPADKYIEMSEIIVGIPPPSTTLFTASLQCPEKIILSLDLNQEFLGDSYKDFNGIEYIGSEKKFTDILKLIRDNKYRREYKKDKREKLRPVEFSSTIEMLNSLYRKSV